MFNFRNNTESELDEPIAAVLNEMAINRPDSDEYTELLSHLTRLYEIKATDKPDRVSRDTVWLVLGNFAGILTIVAYEYGHVVGSRALNFVLKPKKN